MAMDTAMGTRTTHGHGHKNLAKISTLKTSCDNELTPNCVCVVVIRYRRIYNAYRAMRLDSMNW
jgi:hypothetical protein